MQRSTVSQRSATSRGAGAEHSSDFDNASQFVEAEDSSVFAVDANFAVRLSDRVPASAEIVGDGGRGHQLSDPRERL